MLDASDDILTTEMISEQNGEDLLHASYQTKNSASAVINDSKRHSKDFDSFLEQNHGALSMGNAQ